MSDLFDKEEVLTLVGLCLEIHRELGKDHEEVICKDAFAAEWHHARIPFHRERKCEVSCKGVVQPHFHHADFVVSDKIPFKGETLEKLTEAHIKQVLNYLAASKLQLGLLVNFGADSLERKRVVLSRKLPGLPDLRE